MDGQVLLTHKIPIKTKINTKPISGCLTLTDSTVVMIQLAIKTFYLKWIFKFSLFVGGMLINDRYVLTGEKIVILSRIFILKFDF